MGKHSQTKDDKENVKNVNKKRVDDNPKKINKKSTKKKKRRRAILIILLLVLIGFGIFVGVKVHSLEGNWLAFMLGHNKETRTSLDKLQVLILGESTGMSDTIIVASYDPKTQEAALLSIPRDTFIGSNLDSASAYNKINSLYSHGETPEKTLEAVNEITGLNVQYYVLVDTEALIKLVDIIGGLEYDVPTNMNYDDPTQNLHIHLTAGLQKLTGAQVEQLVRFRHNNNGTSYPTSYGNEDHGRMRTQRGVIIALAKQSLKLKNVTEISNIIDIFKEYVKTNMNLDIIKDYIPYAIEMNADNVKVGKIPGIDDVANGLWFFFYDEEGTKQMVDELFYGVTPPAESETPENNTSSDAN